ncbi:uncharacterized protein YALI1_A08115g [Yarrowia lipolytica]|uniref:Uncharacterized protein n=1 Tax=Yarrowia lipolytica TaxID=4952 RepID=A0A1D8N444_YARLL|nr:hypothetical protein YALI1_A08115g [Yarrowia lipolytica]
MFEVHRNDDGPVEMCRLTVSWIFPSTARPADRTFLQLPLVSPLSSPSSFRHQHSTSGKRSPWKRNRQDKTSFMPYSNRLAIKTANGTHFRTLVSSLTL